MVQMTKTEVAGLIESFINNRSGVRDWDDFLSVRLSDPQLETVRERCARLPEEFPPTEKGHYCGLDGIKVLKDLAAQLRGLAF